MSECKPYKADLSDEQWPRSRGTLRCGTYETRRGGLVESVGLSDREAVQLGTDPGFIIESDTSTDGS
ncbi:hypothetical protein QQM39_25105 [Streptomyces sp. DT2A-34]|uniref:hypothetical protein n=1 Tax=Streptomyces sp. DT2A-34 TaxID=3051182 RepID=UPI00265C7094|nr:hypothetical protein [Streptomyces sp. DT2A-34]MDO0913987.1 hypothetical protein [Streptomyces sp. DT2A-34]